jgi:hypothetical protein
MRHIKGYKLNAVFKIKEERCLDLAYQRNYPTCGKLASLVSDFTFLWF